MTKPPYSAEQTPNGYVVFCAAHVVTEEIKHDEAVALAAALNLEFNRKHNEDT